MNKRIFFVLAMLFFLSGCGPRKTNLLNRLRLDMTKETVKSKIGMPERIHCPQVEKNGDIVDYWEYSLATVDKQIEDKTTALKVVGSLIFWPVLCFPSTWESPYDYDVYILKFINNLLKKWGSLSAFAAELANVYKKDS